MQFLLDNYMAIIAIVGIVASWIISPRVKLRTAKTKLELEEMKTFIQKNRLIREEMDAMAARISALEKLLLAEQLKNQRLENEIATLRDAA